MNPGSTTDLPPITGRLVATFVFDGRRIKPAEVFWELWQEQHTKRLDLGCRAGIDSKGMVLDLYVDALQLVQAVVDSSIRGSGERAIAEYSYAFRRHQATWYNGDGLATRYHEYPHRNEFGAIVLTYILYQVDDGGSDWHYELRLER